MIAAISFGVSGFNLTYKLDDIDVFVGKRAVLSIKWVWFLPYPSR